MIVMPMDYYHRQRMVPCHICRQHEVTATDSQHFEPGMGLGILTTFGPCTSNAADRSEK